MPFSLPQDTQSRPVTVIGGGTLGRRIALMFASAGGEARIVDLDADVRSAAVEFVEAQLPGVVAGRQGASVGTVRAFESLKEGLDGAWLVSEAVPERLDLKRKLFGQLDAGAPADAILTTNSSSYASRLMLDNVKATERVLNMHFYMPPQQYAVDLMSDGETEPAILEFLVADLPRYGLRPFVAQRESTGFIFNRIWAAIKRESLAVVADGVSTPEDIDAMFKINMGTAVGPFELMDKVGLDVVLDIENHYAQENPSLPEGPRRLLREYVESGRLGQKTAQGFYTYSG